MSVAFIVSITTTSQAAPEGWASTYGGDGYDHAVSILQTGDGGYIVAGQTEPLEAESRDFWVLKLSSDGTVEWQKVYGGLSGDEAVSIGEAGDGGYIVAGETTSFGDEMRSAWVLKLGPDGVVEWQKTYRAAGIDEALSMQPTGDGGCIVAGATHDFRGPPVDVWVLKLGSDGVVDWQKSYRGGGFCVASSVRRISDGGYIVAGKKMSLDLETMDAWVLKLRPDGTVEWQKTYGGSEGSNALSVQQTGDGGYIVAGKTSLLGAGDVDAWVLKLRPDGTVEWQKAYGGGYQDWANSIQQTGDGGYIVAGETVSLGAGSIDAWVLKLGPDGTVEWQKAYGGGAWDGIKSIRQTGDGGYIAAGDTKSFGAGEVDMWVLKLRPDGSISSSCDFISDTDVSGIDTNATTTDTGASVMDIKENARDTLAGVQDTNVPANLLCVPTAVE